MESLWARCGLVVELLPVAATSIVHCKADFASILTVVLYKFCLLHWLLSS